MNHREVTSKEAAENILKTILTLHMKCGHAYVSEIAEKLEMNLTSTYTVIAQMVKDELLIPLEGSRGRRAQKQSIQFTPKGEALARSVFERHQTIQKWLNRLGISMEQADVEACSMEHGITERTMLLLREHVRLATELTSHNPKNADKSMREIMEAMIGHQEKTFSEETMALLEQVGGTEGLSRKQALIDRAQGEENLERILDAVEEVGGAEALQQQNRDCKLLMQMAEGHGGTEELGNLLLLVDHLGGKDTLWELMGTAKRFGGLSNLLHLADEQYRLWESVLTPSEMPSK